MPTFTRLRAFFMARPLRERLLILAVISVLVILWGTSTANRLRAGQTAFRSTGAELELQEKVLAKRAEINERLSTLLQRIEPGRTLSATRLNAELASIGARLQINPEVPAARTERVDRFLTHATEVQIRRTSYEKLVEFAQEIAGRSPYLNLEQVLIGADRSNPALLDARFRITAVELHSQP